MIFFLKILSALLLCTTIASATHYRVYLIGGQSNGSGRGDSTELSLPPLDAEGLDAPQGGVRFYWHKTQATIAPNGTLTQDAWIDLQTGSGHGVNSPAGHDSEFGPELSFGRDIAAAQPGVNVAIIKYTHGGTNLHTQWSATGTNYGTFLTTVELGLAGLTAEGHTYELAGMLWVQGEADIFNANAAAYEANLIDFIERVRTDVFVDTGLRSYPFPFLISGLSSSQYSNVTTAGEGPYVVRQAQETVGAIPDYQTGFVNTDGLPTYSNGVVHFMAAAQVAIGEASAVEMLALQANDADRDGLLLNDETSLGTNPNLADSDGDRQDDGFEVAAGTDPLKPSSFFRITEFDLVGEDVTLQWPSLPGNSYQIEVSQDLMKWSVAESNYLADEQPATTTAWTAGLNDLFTPVVEDDGTFVLYDAQSELNGDFNTVAFDSTDTHSVSNAARMTQGGSLTGGGAGLFILNRESDKALFDGHSDSGWPGFNFGDVDTADQAAAAAAGDFFSFVVGVSESVTYESLSFFSNQFSTSGQVDVSYRIGSGSEVFVVQGLTPAISNAPVALEEIDFPDFSTMEDVTWTFYIYNSGGAGFGIRFDDIKLTAATIQVSANQKVISRFDFTGPPWTAQKEPDFSAFAANAPSSDADQDTSTSFLSNSGYSNGGYNSFYIRDIDGGTVGAADGSDFTIFSTSDTPGVGLNFANAGDSSPTNYLAFTVSPVGGEVTYGELSFFTGASSANETYQIELRAWDGVSETILGQSTHTSGATTNAPVAQKVINFTDFASSDPIEFRLYGYNLSSSTVGLRFDDITLTGPQQESGIESKDLDRLFFRVRLFP